MTLEFYEIQREIVPNFGQKGARGTAWEQIHFNPGVKAGDSRRRAGWIEIPFYLLPALDHIGRQLRGEVLQRLAKVSGFRRIDGVERNGI